MPKWLTFIVLILNACAVSESSRHELSAQSNQPVMHAIQSSELRELMDRMDILMHERFMTEQEVDMERRKYAKRIAAAAEKLSKTVDAIHQVLPSLNLNTDEKNTFQFLAHKLDDQARTLETQARLNQIDAIENTLNQISATCATCHSLFRQPDR